MAMNSAQIRSILTSLQKVVPAFDPKNPDLFFKQYLRQTGTDGMSDIYDGTEVRPTISAGNSQLEVDIFAARNKICYQLLSTSLQAHSIEACALIDKATLWDGKEAWDILFAEYNSKTPLTKMLSVTSLFRCKMGESELVNDFANRFEKAFSKLTTLGVTMADIMCCLFICSLNRKFAPFETSVMLKDTIEMRKTVVDARAFEERFKAREADYNEETAVANVATASAMFAGKTGEAGGVFVSNEEYKKLKAKAASSKPRLDHDPSTHPNRPTQFEKTLNCNKCGIFGHARRTCPNPDRDEQQSSSGESTPPVKSKKKKASAQVARTRRVVDEDSGDDRIIEAWRTLDPADRERNRRAHAFMMQTIHKTEGNDSPDEEDEEIPEDSDNVMQVQFKLSIMQARIDELEKDAEDNEDAWDANQATWEARLSEAIAGARPVFAGSATIIPPLPQLEGKSRGRRQRRKPLRSFKKESGATEAW
jgi:hypothetical protein